MRIPLPLILALGLVGGTGCGYKLGVLRHDGVGSIAVPIFEYRALEQRRGIEYDLTDAVAEEMISRSSLKLSTPERADAVLYGQITDFKERVLLEDENNNILESSVSVIMNLRLVKRDGEVLFLRERMMEQSRFTVVAGEDEADARRRAFNDMAERIVLAMEGDW